MSRIPEDPEARRVWLEQWTAARSREVAEKESLRARVRPKIDAFAERQIERLDPLLDRRLKTNRDLHLPEPDGPGLMYVAGPSPWHVLPRALRRLGASDADVFVEFGCGTGRVVHQAAKWPLKKVIGVEILPEVADLARQLVAAQQRKYRCESVEIVTCDVARFRVPDDLTIAYLAYGYKPETTDALLGNLIDSLERRPRHVHLIHYWPRRSGADVLATGRFRLVPDLSFGSTLIFESVLPQAESAHA